MSLHRGFAFLLLFAVTAICAPGAPGQNKGRVVQIVYESDTRGYYLPCG